MASRLLLAEHRRPELTVYFRMAENIGSKISRFQKAQSVFCLSL